MHRYMIEKINGECEYRYFSNNTSAYWYGRTHEDIDRIFRSGGHCIYRRRNQDNTFDPQVKGKSIVNDILI